MAFRSFSGGRTSESEEVQGDTRQISLLPARPVSAAKRQGLEPFFNIGFTPGALHVSVMREMVFCRRQHPFSSQRHSGWQETQVRLVRLKSLLSCLLLSRAGHELESRLARAVRNQVAGRHQAGHSFSNDIFSHHDMLGSGGRSGIWSRKGRPPSIA
jgi:hypothetical protein